MWALAQVEVFEEKDVVGGACRTEYPFPKVPGLAQSTGAYLLGVLPPELKDLLGLDGVKLLRRDPHYFLPTTGEKYLLFGSDQAAMKQQFLKFFSQEDWAANQRLQEEIGALRDDIAPACLQEPLSLEESAERYIRPQLRDTFVDLCRQPVSRYLDKFGFKSDLLKLLGPSTLQHVRCRCKRGAETGNSRPAGLYVPHALTSPIVLGASPPQVMYAVTDGFSGLTGGWDTPGTGMNFLVHNLCRLPGSDGTWMVVQGGMGAVTQQLATAALHHGARIHTGQPIQSILVGGGVARGVVTGQRREHRAPVVLVNADPFRLRQLAGEANFPAGFNARLDAMKKDGTTMKVNMALRGLPQFKCLTEDLGQHRTTTHLLPDESTVLESVTQAFEDVRQGRLPEFPTIEVYYQTTVDPSIQDASRQHHSAALFVQWVPFELAGTSWEAEEERYVEHLIGILDRFAPGAKDLVVDTFTLTPPKVESYFGISRGHIHHIDNSFGFTDRFPYSTPIQGLYSCSAGCHPAGSVMGCAGHNAASRIIADLGLRRWW
ncbi:hypothetical protein N2152v2_004886 [Parachlorella kessleri]